MMKYKITITEVLSREVEIEADSKESAIDKVRDDYYDEKYVLTSEDYKATDFSAEEIVKQKSTRNRDEK